jgi:hydrogenase expression/formation protein HypC
MCLALPMQVVSATGHQAVCRGRNGLERVDTLITGPLAPGQWVLCFLGAAREIVDAERARLVGAALDALEAIGTGRGDLTALMDSHFADLVGREPQLPDFLRPNTTEEPT